MPRYPLLAPLSLLGLTLAAGSAPAGIKPSVRLAFPLSFVQNEGQSSASDRFLVSGPGAALALQDDGIRLSLPTRHADGKRGSDPIALRFLGMDPRASLQGAKPQATLTNVFRGSDRSKWLEGIPTFAQARYRGVYPGTDLLCYGAEGKLEYDWVLSPGADPSRIKVAFQGARGLKVDAQGNLVARTAHGELVQSHPVAYQVVDGEKQPVLARFTLGKAHQVGFSLGAYDPSRELIIDPVLSWSKTVATGSAPTNTGGTYEIFGQGGVAVAPDGDVIVAWSDYTEPVGGGVNTPYMHVQRRTADGNTIVYTTTLGGGAFDSNAVNALAVDGSGNAYVLGNTNDPNFPITTGSLSGYTNYVLKLNASGGVSYSSLLNSLNSLAANNSSTVAPTLAVDSSGNAFICGTDYSETLPSTTGGFQPTHYNDDAANALDGIGNAHGDDAWVAKLDGSGAIAQATYLGGDDWDSALALTVDGSGNVLVAGETCSSNLATGGAYKTTHPNDVYDVADGLFNYSGFVAKLNNTLSSRSWCTYLGGSGGPSGGTVGFDEAVAITADGSGNAYVALNADSTDIDASGGAQSAHGGDGGGADVYLARLSSDGSTRMGGTYLGGDAGDSADHIALDGAGNVYVTGFTGAPTSPATVDFPSIHALYTFDATNGSVFLTRLSGSLATIAFSTPISNGTSPVYGKSALLGMALDPSTETVFVAGTDPVFSETALNLAAFTNAAPTVSAANLGSIQQGGSIQITYATLATASSLADADGDTPLRFHAQSVDSGTLKDFNGNDVVVGTTELAAGAGQAWTWTPDPSAHGAPLNAFTFSGYDGLHDSSAAQASATVNGAPTISSVLDQTTGNSGAGFPVSFTVSDDTTAPGSIIVTGTSSNHTLLPDANIAISNSSGSCTATLTPVAGQVGTTVITLQVSDGAGGTASTNFNFTTSDSTAPTGVTATENGLRGGVFFAGGATDDVGVTKVEFYLDGSLYGTRTTAPYIMGWNSALGADGSHGLYVIAYDGAGNSTSSSTATFSIDNTPPSVSCSENGARGGVYFHALASDNIGVSKVKFYLDGSLYGTRTTAPYIMGWNSALGTDGSHSFYAVAYDLAGNATTASTTTFSIDNTSPSVSCAESGTNGGVFFSATASDNIGVAKVVFFLDGAYYGTQTVAPYKMGWNSAAGTNGSHSLYAVAYDAAGNATTSSTTTFSISN